MSDLGTPAEENIERLNFDYIKGNLFRTVRPDGAIGALTPAGFLQIAFYSERQAIPQRIIYKMEPDGSVGDEIERIGRNAIVRELEVAIALDIRTAESIIEFLTKMLKDAKNVEGGHAI